MGLMIEISDRVSIELRRTSVILYVEDPSDADSVPPEWAYEDVQAIIGAFTRVTKESRYFDYMGAKLQHLSPARPK